MEIAKFPENTNSQQKVSKVTTQQQLSHEEVENAGEESFQVNIRK